MDGRSITPARRLDAAPAELRASSTRQTITARPSTSARSSTTPDTLWSPPHRGARPGPHFEELRPRPDTPDFEAFNPE